MRKILTTPPAIEPVDLAETKLHCRITISEDDDLVSGLIVAARQYVEHYLQSALITQTWTFYFDSDEDIFDSRYLRLTMKPILSITSLKTFSDANVASVFDAANYRLSDGRILLNDLSSWPYSYRLNDSLEVVVVTGYGPLKTDVPNAIRLAIKMLVAQWYEKRESVFDPTDSAAPNTNLIPFGVTALLTGYRNYFV